MKRTNKYRKNRYFHYQKEILNTISEPASFINKNYRYVFVNNAFNKFYNKETDEIIGQTGAKIWGNENYENKIKPHIDECLTGKHVFFQYEGEMPNSTFKILEINYYPHRKSSNIIDGVISTAKDITEQKKAEQALKESEARLKELNVTKDKLFSIIGHDLKGPLNNIIGFSELIEEAYDNYSSEEIRKYNKLIYQLSQDISSLLENLLTWSRSQRNKITVSPQNTGLYFIVEKCFSLLEQNALQKQIRLKNNVPPEALIYADEEMITTVMRNLISNAIKFTNRGGTISAVAKPSKKMIITEISDTGIGIPKEKAQKLFQPNENQPGMGTEGEKGTGLGLIICKDLVEKNGGEIWVESEPEQGSVFFFSLPAKNHDRSERHKSQ
jgi:PAS domain S-box-containing protein